MQSSLPEEHNMRKNLVLSPLRAAASLSEISRSSSNGLLVRLNLNQSQYMEVCQEGSSAQPVGWRTRCERSEHGVGDCAITMPPGLVVVRLVVGRSYWVGLP